jgi:hypothetical protein
VLQAITLPQPSLAGPEQGVSRPKIALQSIGMHVAGAHASEMEASRPPSMLPLDDALALALEEDDAASLPEVAEPPWLEAPELVEAGAPPELLDAAGVPPEPVALPLCFTGAVREHATMTSTGNETRIARDGDMAPAPHRTRYGRHFGPLA